MMTKRSKQKFYSVALCVVLGILLLPLLFLAGCTKSPPPDPAKVEVGKQAFAACTSRSDFIGCDDAFLRFRSDPAHVYWLHGYEVGIGSPNYVLGRKTLWMQAVNGDGMYADVEEVVLPSDSERWDAMAVEFMRQQIWRRP